MPLLILLFIAVIIGYLIARSRASKKIDETAASAVSTTKSVASKTTDRLRGRPSSDQLKGWAAGSGAEYLSQDFRDWLASLNQDDTRSFTVALNDHMSGLGYNLKDLVEGKMQDQPEHVKTYAEAVDAYSQTYQAAHSQQPG